MKQLGTAIRKIHCASGGCWIALAAVGCFIFGLALIANVQLGGDGCWYWYPKLMLGGQLLYSNLHFALQPFFPLWMEANQKVFGESWLASKIPAVVSLSVFVGSIYFLIQKSEWDKRQNFIIFLFSFFFGIRFEAYRFDDYHVVSDNVSLLASLVLLGLYSANSKIREILLVVGLAGLTAVSAMNRLNDGAILFVFAFVAIFVLRRSAFLALLYAIGTFCSALSIILLTGDSVKAWFINSVLAAGSIKGGTTELLFDPFRLLQTAASWFFSYGILTTLCIAIVAISAILALNQPFRRFVIKNKKNAILYLIPAGAIAFLIANWETGNLEISFLAFGIYASFAIGISVFFQFVKEQCRPHSRRLSNKRLLLLLPLATCCSTSLSSAGSFSDLYNPIALLVLLIPIAWPTLIRGIARTGYVAILSVVTLSVICYRTVNPASWISYHTFPLFVNRTIFTHASYGPMVIDNRLLRFNQHVCAAVEDGDSSPALLSLPWTYANYFCAIRPWRNYVQTWFDITPKPVIIELQKRLEGKPPSWILYQRQLDVLAGHEMLFNGGKALPQRDLDAFIMHKVQTGAWRIALSEQGDSNSLWMLINTTVPQTELHVISFGKNLLDLRNWNVADDSDVWSVLDHGERIVASSSHGSLEDQVLSRRLAVSRDGPITIFANISTGTINSTGARGYEIDVVDNVTKEVVGTTGLSTVELHSADFILHASLHALRKYTLRLHSNLNNGTVSFSNLRFEYGFKTYSDFFNSRDAASIKDIVNGSWNVAVHPVIWSDDVIKDVQGISARELWPDRDQSILVQPIRFSYDGPAIINIKGIFKSRTANDQDIDDKVDLYDTTVFAVCGGVTFTSADRGLAVNRKFSAFIDHTHTYQLRITSHTANSELRITDLSLDRGLF